jgi:alpha-glucuronidase
LPEISEYAALFTAYSDLAGVTAFTNVQSDVYWSGTELAAGNRAWYFRCVFHAIPDTVPL